MASTVSNPMRVILNTIELVMIENVPINWIKKLNESKLLAFFGMGLL
jgi:hypothetical protein